MESPINKGNIFEYIVQEQVAFSLPIPFGSHEWNFKDHIDRSFDYKNSKYFKGSDDKRPFKNIVLPILNLRYRAEDIDVKDIILYVDDDKKYYLSFLVKKYHDEVYVKEHDLDTFIDELKEEKIDFGGGLAKEKGLEVVPLQSMAFCDQTDMLSNPFGIKHFYSPDQLQEMVSNGWGDESNGATATIDEVITMMENYKSIDDDVMKTRTTGKNIEVIEVHGTLPDSFLDEDSDKYSRQMQIVVMDKKAKRERNENKGVILFRKREKNLPFKLVLGDKIYSRALGRGGVEELFEDQVWTNYSEIRMKKLLDAASTIIHITDDPAFAKRNRNLSNVDNNEVLELEQGKILRQMDTLPRSIGLFERAIAENQAHARMVGSAQEAITGEEPPAGTPFKSVQFQAMESHSLHEYRKGKYAKDIEEIYRDWIIPEIGRKITEGKKFLANLSFDELQKVVEDLSENTANRMRNEQVLNGELPEDKETLKQKIREGYMKKGNMQFIEILKGEMKDLPIRISINVSGKQANLAQMTDKIVNIFRFIISNPQGFAQVMQMPGMSKAWNEILEYSGLSPVDFGGIQSMQMPQQMPQQMAQMPQLQALTK